MNLIEGIHSLGLLVWDTNMVSVSLFWDTNMATVTSSEYSILQSVSHVYFPSLSILFLLWKGVGGCVMTTSSLSALHPSINQSE